VGAAEKVAPKLTVTVLLPPLIYVRPALNILVF
jgi:hypothetical protein